MSLKDFFFWVVYCKWINIIYYIRQYIIITISSKIYKKSSPPQKKYSYPSEHDLVLKKLLIKSKLNKWLFYSTEEIKWYVKNLPNDHNLTHTLVHTHTHTHRWKDLRSLLLSIVS